MKIQICIGSSCHLRGSQKVIEEITRLVTEKGLQDKIELSGSFCMGACSKGVSVKIDEQDIFHVNPVDTEDFFVEVILEKL